VTSLVGDPGSVKPFVGLGDLSLVLEGCELLRGYDVIIQPCGHRSFGHEVLDIDWPIANGSPDLYVWQGIPFGAAPGG